MPAHPSQTELLVPLRPTIAFITNSLTPYWVHLYLRFARELEGINVTVCTLFEQGDQPWSLDEIRDLHFTCVGRGEGSRRRGLANVISDWQKAGRVIRWLKETKPAAAVIGGYADVCRARIIAWCHRAGIPVLLHVDSNVRSPRPTGLRAVAKQRFFSILFRMVKGVLVCGRNGADYFSSYNYPSESVFLCPVEPDYALIESITEAEISATLAKHRLEPQRKRMVACARLIAFKRIDLAIDAFAALAGQRPEWDLLIVGSGPLEEELKSRVPPHLRDRVKFLGFIGNQREVSALYRASHVLVHPADYEPFGLVILEAVSAGMAVVCSSIVGASPEVVAEGVNGRYFPVGNLRMLVDALRDATGISENDAYRTASPRLVEDWRQRGDPVGGLREGLTSLGFYSGSADGA